MRSSLQHTHTHAHNTKCAKYLNFILFMLRGVWKRKSVSQLLALPSPALPTDVAQLLNPAGLAPAHKASFLSNSTRACAVGYFSTLFPAARSRSGSTPRGESVRPDQVLRRADDCAYEQPSPPLAVLSCWTRY